MQYNSIPKFSCVCLFLLTDNHEDFTNKVCWVSNTYYVPTKQKHIPEEYEGRTRIGYYQWVPLILLAQAMLFYIPCMFWRIMNNKAGIDINNLIETCKNLQQGGYYGYTETNTKFMVRHLDQSLRCKRDFKKHFCGRFINCIGRYTVLCGKRQGNYILVLYLFTKVMYLLNVTGQVIALNFFLGTSYHAYGFEILYKMAQNEEWSGSDVFPRVTLCDFYIRTFANTQKHTVQCVLPMNLFNEKFYIFLWFWFIFIGFTSLLNLVIWIYRSVVTSNHTRYIKHHLVARNIFQVHIDDSIIKEEVANFTKLYLKQDGMLALRLIGINVNEVASADLVKALFEFYTTSVKGYRKQKERRKSNVEEGGRNDELSSIESNDEP